MAKVDLHVHSLYSQRPAEWFLQKIGTRESYSEIDFIYSSCKESGMDFVTITDHNTIDGAIELVSKYPENTFTGVEVTTYFPDNECKVHVLVWDLDEKQFQEINVLRKDIFDLRMYLKEQDLAHAVAHATFSINKKLTINHFEKLLLLFDYFEGINGSREKQSNDILITALMELTPATMEMLHARHKIEPFGETSWFKGVVGGSDDHSGLFIAKTFTEAATNPKTPTDFIKAIRSKDTIPGGRSNDFRGFAFSLYKIAYDFSCSQSSKGSSGLISMINNLLFEKKSSTILDRLQLQKMRLSASPEKRQLITLISECIHDFEKYRTSNSELKLDIFYHHVTRIMDELVTMFADSVDHKLAQGDMLGLIQKLSEIIAPAFLSLPFFTTINILHESRRLCDDVERNFNRISWPVQKKILWFTDTLFDLNGVSESLKEIARQSQTRKLNLTIVTCLLPEEENQQRDYPTIMNLPLLRTYTPSFFDTYTVRLPSILASLKLIYDHHPDEIIISTPGPVGLLGLLCGHLLHIPCSGVYHTDFGKYAALIIGDQNIVSLVEMFLQWFYNRCSTILVPTLEYISLLEEQGYPRQKCKLFQRGIDKKIFTRQPMDTMYLKQMYCIPDGFNLLYVGRISREKNITTLFSIFTRIAERNPLVNLLLCGSGPDYGMYVEMYSHLKNVFFLGRIERNELPLIYANSHLMLFPSVTDTFGMAVLEAQACGLPAIVSDQGGPKEIVIDESTGYVISANDLNRWVEKTETLIAMHREDHDSYETIRFNAWHKTHERFDWSRVFSSLFSDDREESFERSNTEGVSTRQAEVVEW